MENRERYRRYVMHEAEMEGTLFDSLRIGSIVDLPAIESHPLNVSGWLVKDLFPELEEEGGDIFGRENSATIELDWWPGETHTFLRIPLLHRDGITRGLIHIWINEDSVYTDADGRVWRGEGLVNRLSEGTLVRVQGAETMGHIKEPEGLYIHGKKIWEALK